MKSVHDTFHKLFPGLPCQCDECHARRTRAKDIEESGKVFRSVAEAPEAEQRLHHRDSLNEGRKNAS